MSGPVDQPNEEACGTLCHCGEGLCICSYPEPAFCEDLACAGYAPRHEETCESCGHAWEMHGPEVPGCCECRCRHVRPAPSPAGDLSEQETLADELVVVAELATIICAHGRISSLGMAELLDWLAARDADLTRRAARDALLGAAGSLEDHTACCCEPDDHLEFVAGPTWLRAYADEHYPEVTP